MVALSKEHVLTRPFRILCAVDASPPAAAAFEQALAMSAHRGAQLVLVHAVSKDHPYSWGAVERVAALAALRERAEAQSVPVRVRVQHGDIAGVILLHARAQAPDLIVLGSYEPLGLARLRFRSIADRVVNGAACPALLVPAATGPATPTFRNIICAVDLSSRTAAMITSVLRFAEGDERLVCLHVLPDSMRRRYGRFGIAESSKSAADGAHQQLQTLHDTQSLESEVLVSVSSTSVHDEILRVAIDRNADLIVVGATRRAGLRRRLLSSTALRLSRRSALPVLILPAVHIKRALSALDEAVLGWAA
jgi:nucleotide-binding universal stress UspA family protein